MYVCIYVCMCVYIYTECIYSTVCMYVYIYMYICVCMCIYIYIPLCVTHTDNEILLSHTHTKKDEIMISAIPWMDLEISILSEVSQTEKDKYHKILLTCVC